MNLLNTITEFEWDAGNSTKNWISHKVKKTECEQVFFNKPIFISPDIRHSVNEERFLVLGKTKRGRKLFLSFTIRSNKIRVITARDQNRKERKQYEKV